MDEHLELRKEIKRLQRAIRIFESMGRYGRANQVRRALWDLLDKAWRDRVTSTHEHVSTHDLKRRVN